GAIALPRFAVTWSAVGVELLLALRQILGRRLQGVVHLDRRLLQAHRRLSAVNGNGIRRSDARRLRVRLNLRPAVHVDAPRKTNSGRWTRRDCNRNCERQSRDAKRPGQRINHAYESLSALCLDDDQPDHTSTLM